MKVVDAGAVFMRIRNRGATDDRLIGVQTPLSTRPRLHDPALSHQRLEESEFEPLTIPAAQASRLIDQLRAGGARPIACPAIATIEPESWDPLDAALRGR
mgnify:CR=1 FL=1